MLKFRRDHEIFREAADGYTLRFHFSFKDYQASDYNGFGALRLFNDDFKLGALRNRMHRHANLELVTYIVEGTFRHEDSLGNSFILPAGSAECVSAGTGLEHAEHNASETEPLRMILLYFVPDTPDLPPAVNHKIFSPEERVNKWCQIAGPIGSDDSAVVIHQLAYLYATTLTPYTELTYNMQSDRGVYLYLIVGEISIEDDEMSTGDAAMITDQNSITVKCMAPSQLLLVDVPLIKVTAETDKTMKGDVDVMAKN